MSPNANFTIKKTNVVAINAAEYEQKQAFTGYLIDLKIGYSNNTEKRITYIIFL